MKDNFIYFSRKVIILFVLILPCIVLGTNDAAVVDESLNPLGSVGSLWQLLEKVLNVIAQIGVPVAALAIVYSGYLFVSAMGDEKQLTNAKEVLKWTMIGLAVLLGARAIVEVIKSTVTNLG